MKTLGRKSPFERSKDFNITQLQFENAEFTYGGIARPLFHNLDLNLSTGKNVWITGEAGAGQSSLLRLIAAVTSLTRGHYRINGEDVMQMSFEELLPYRLKIAYSFEYGGLFSNYTLLDNLVLPLAYHKVCSAKTAIEKAEALAERFRFTSQLLQRPATVSGGLRKLGCILRATMMGPEMLVMDDPFTGLDPETSRTLLALIGEKRAEGELRHLFLTSREENWVKKLDSELLVIEKGFAQVRIVKADSGQTLSAA